MLTRSNQCPETLAGYFCLETNGGHWKHADLLRRWHQQSNYEFKTDT